MIRLDLAAKGGLGHFRRITSSCTWMSNAWSTRGSEAPVHHFQLPQPASHLDSKPYYFVFERHAK